MNQITVNFTECTPEPSGGYILLWRVVGSGDPYTNGGSFPSSPIIFLDGTNPDGSQYEGYIYSDCGGGQTGEFQPWSTFGSSAYSISFDLCQSGFRSNFTIHGGTVSDTVTVRATFNGILQKTGGNFTRADLGMAILAINLDTSACYSDAAIHSFSVFVEETFVMTGTTQSFTTDAVIHNGSESPTNLSVEITVINGVNQAGISQSGCKGNSGTGGTC